MLCFSKNVSFFKVGNLLDYSSGGWEIIYRKIRPPARVGNIDRRGMKRRRVKVENWNWKLPYSVKY
jgi:hypothetical protein